MFFSFPTSFLCFSWNSFAASSCDQSPGDRVGQRPAEGEAQGAEYRQDQHTPPPSEAALTRREQKMCIWKSPKGQTRSRQQLRPHTSGGRAGVPPGTETRGAGTASPYTAPPPPALVVGVGAEHPSSRGKGAQPVVPGLQRERTRSSLRVFRVGSITTSFTATICSSMARSCTSLNSCKTTARSRR